MDNGFNMMGTAKALMAHAARRQVLVAGNVANADTPGYRAVDLQGFDKVMASGGRSDPLQMTATRVKHLTGASWHGGMALEDVGREASPNGNTVSLEDEMFRQADIRREHDLALAVYNAGLGLSRTATGR